MPRTYIWQLADWPALHYDVSAAAPALLAAHEARGRVHGMAQAIGLEGIGDVVEGLWTQEAVATAAIEGERLELAAVRSSVMRRLDLPGSGPAAPREVEGLVEVMEDALTRFDAPMDEDRLCRWQSALFPGGTAGLRRIVVGRYRDHEDAMQIVSGPIGREKVHYTAPASRDVPMHMAAFLAWFNMAPGTGNEGGPPPMDGIARAAIAHLWFETIHPFEDGNGRIGRALADMALAQDGRSPVRLYGLSRQLLADRRGYYDALAQAQGAGLDVTPFVQWFALAFERACNASCGLIERSIEKSRFWAAHAQATLNERQRRLVQRLLDAGDGGFLGGLNIEKYLKMVDVSKPTATRDLGDLVQRGMMRTHGQGKALRYYLDVPGWTHGQD